MEKITVSTDDFRVFLMERNKLYEMYGKDYNEKIPAIYEKLANILNKDTFFTEMVEKGVNDRDYQQSALQNLKIYLMMSLYDFSEDELNDFKEKKDLHKISDTNVLKKINSILGNQEQRAYLDVLYSITKILYGDYIYQILESYISEKEPALSECEGVKDISQCDFIIDRYKEYVDSLSADATPKGPNVDDSGQVIVRKGDLYHGTNFSEQVIESIANKGLVSGQLIGIHEDGETFMCVDFFKATKDSTPEEICTSGKRFTNGPNQVVFVINHSNLEGEDEVIPNITNYDAYNEKTHEGQKAREIVNVRGLPLDYLTGAAILIGVPPFMISSIIVNSKIEEDEEKINFLSSHFPKATIVSRQSGEILRRPIEISKSK